MGEIEGLEAERRNFLVWSVGSLAVALAADVLGRSLGAVPGTALLRLALVVAFFTGIACAVWSLTEPLAAYLRARARIAYREAGTNVQSASARLVGEIERFAKSLTTPLISLVVVVMLRVLDDWTLMRALAPLGGLLEVASLGCVGWFAVQVGRSTNRVGLLYALASGIRRQLEVAGVVPVTVERLREEARALEGPAVVALDGERFAAGGIDWSFGEFRTNAIVLGQTGSGKTVTVLNTFVEGLLSIATPARVAKPPAALILDPKGDYLDKIARLCDRLGRRDDLVVFDPEDPEHSVVWNPLDAPDDNPLEIAGRFAAVLQLLGMKSERDSFFIDQAKLFVRHAVALVRASSIDGSPPSLAEVYALSKQPDVIEARLLLLDLAEGLRRADPERPYFLGNLAEVASGLETMKVVVDALVAGTLETAGLRSFFRRFQMLTTSERAEVIDELRTLVMGHEDEPIERGLGPAPIDTRDFFLNAWFELPEKTRDSVRGQLTTMLDPFLLDPYPRVLSGRSTVRLGDVLDRGLIFYVHMPSARQPEMSRTLNTLIKLAYFREVLRRVRKERRSLFVCDEFQKYFTAEGGAGDAGFFELCRESNHANLIATQSLAALQRDAENEKTVDSLLTNCGVKVFLRNHDPGTNEYAEKLGGTYKEIDLGIGRSTGQGGGRRGLESGFQVSESAQDRPRFTRDAFATLDIPAAGSPSAQAIAVLSGRQPPEVRRLRFKVNPL